MRPLVCFAIFLFMVLLRPDAWPHGDVALAENWRPHRATGARWPWHAYLSSRAV